jgi:hypothetical protein
VGDVSPRCNRRHQRLRPVASGHPDDLRAARNRVLGQLEQVIAWLKDDRLDSRRRASAVRPKRSANSSAPSTRTPCQWVASTTIKPAVASAASATPAVRRKPRRVRANQIAELAPSTSPTASTAIATSPASATAATTAIATGASSAPTAATRGHHGGRAA